MTTYSSRGPTPIDHVVKPDLLAPGNRIVSTRAPGSHLDQRSRARGGRSRFPAGGGVLRDVGDEHGRAHGLRGGRADAGAGARAEPGDGQGEAHALGAEAGGGEPVRHRGRRPRHHGRAARHGARRRRPVAARVPGRRHRPDWLREHRRAVVGARPSRCPRCGPTPSCGPSPPATDPPIVWSYGVLEPDTTVSSEATLWAEATLWSEATLWAESTLWSEGVLWSDEGADARQSQGARGWWTTREARSSTLTP